MAVVPFLIYSLTEGFTKSLSAELWLILAVLVLGNLAWIGMVRSSRRMAAFYEKYPGFRMKKN